MNIFKFTTLFFVSGMTILMMSIIYGEPDAMAAARESTSEMAMTPTAPIPTPTTTPAYVNITVEPTSVVVSDTLIVDVVTNVGLANYTLHVDGQNIGRVQYYGEVSHLGSSSTLEAISASASGNEAQFVLQAIAPGASELHVSAYGEICCWQWGGASSEALSVTVTLPSAPLLYVDADATGSNDGTSWADALTDLQDALAAATAGDEIWVAAATYKPTNGSDRTATFQLQSGVALYGGFDGSETSRDERYLPANPTILSGDLNGDDDDGASTRSDNSLHVVTGSGTDSSAILDGFIVTAGYAYYQEFNGAGMYNLDGTPTISHVTFTGNRANGRGGGMYNASDELILNHVTFIDNQAYLAGGLYNAGSGMVLEDALFSSNLAHMQGHGGGMYNTGADIRLENVTFNDNAASERGGGMYNDAPAIMNNVSFLNNGASLSGGGLHNEQNSLLNHLTFIGNGSSEGGGMYNVGNSELTGAIFKGNTASSGGGLHNRGSPTISNVIFSGNSAAYGGGVYNRETGFTISQATFSGNVASQRGGGISYGPTSLIVTNSIFWNNQDSRGTGSTAQIGDGAGGTVSYSLVQGGFAGTGNIDIDPLFVSPINPDDAPTIEGDFHLQPTSEGSASFASPAIDAADNSAVPPDITDLDGDGDTSEALPFDLDSQPRFVDSPLPDTGNGTAPIVDMGAYEFNPVVLDASVTLQGRPTPPHPRLSVPLDVSLTIPGEITPTYVFTPTTDNRGVFTLTNIVSNTYEIRVKKSSSLQNTQTITLSAGTNPIDLGTLREGDANDDNFVTIIDFSILTATFAVCEGDDGYDARADFNGDGCITILDFSLLASHFGQSGENAPGINQVSPSDVAMSIGTAQASIEPGETFNVTVRLDAGEQQVDGAQVLLNFDPAVLGVEEVMTGDKLEGKREALTGKREALTGKREALPLQLINQFDNQRGTILFAAGTLQEFPSGEIDVMDIQFRAFKAGETALAFDATADGAMGSDVTFAGASVLGELADGVVTVNEPSAVTVIELGKRQATPLPVTTLAAIGLTMLAGAWIVRRQR